MTDIEMLPLPEMEPFATHGSLKKWASDYARAVAEHNVAARDAEIEALRAALAATKAHKENATMSRDGVIQALSEARDELGAEVHRLRAELETAKGQVEFYRTARNWNQQKAERLVEALRELRDLMLGQVKWMPCDCGCPQQRTPDGPHSVTWLRAAQQVEIAIGKSRGVAE